MFNLTSGQIIFLAIYPFIHGLLIAATVFLSLSAGFRKSTDKFPRSEPPSFSRKLVWGLSDLLYYVLSAPLLLLEKLTRTRLTLLTPSGFIAILLNGFFYAVVILSIQQRW